MARAGWALWLGLLALAVLFQAHAGAWRSDFGGHADEAAHVVTGLMVRDYLAGGFFGEWHPGRYARDYYERFPKVALGHYPPGFYAVEALALLPWRSPGAALALMAALAATAGWQVWSLGRERLAGRAAPLALALAFAALPLARIYTAIVMSDLLLLILCLEAARAYGRFMETGAARHSWAFGLLAAAAILTKGSGLLLALLPPLALVLGRRLDLLQSPRLWAAAVPPLLLALPWMLATRHVTAQGMSGEPWGDYLAQAAAFYPAALVRELGLALAALAATGFVLALAAALSRRGRSMEPGEAALWALAGALVLFYAVVPSGLDARYLLPAAPALLVLGAMTLERAARRVRPAAAPWAGVALAVLVTAETARPVEKRYGGASEAVAAAVGAADPGEPVTLLVVSDASGEGAVVAAAAFLAPGRARVIRGSKALASSDWLGRGYQSRVAPGDAAGFRDLLGELGVDWLILDSPPPGGRSLAPHHEAVAGILQETAGSVGQARGIASPRRHGREGAFLLQPIEARPAPAASGP